MSKVHFGGSFNIVGDPVYSFKNVEEDKPAEKPKQKKEESLADKALGAAYEIVGNVKKGLNDFSKNSVVQGLDGTDAPAPVKGSGEALDRVLDEARPANNLKEGAKIVDGLSGVAEVGARQGYAGIGQTLAGATQLAGDVLDSDTLKATAADQRAYADQIQSGAVLRGQPVEGFSKESIVQDVPEAASNAIGSVIQTAPSIGAGMIAPELVYPTMFASTAGQEYSAGRDAGLSPIKAGIRAVPMGAFEVAGEKLGGTDKLVKGMRNATKGNGVADLGAAMLESAIKEVPSEELTTTGQFLVDKAPVVGLNQDATLADYGKAVKDTALATVLQAGGMGAGGALLHHASAVAERVKQLPDSNLNRLRETAARAMPSDLPVIDAEIERRANLGTLTKAAETTTHIVPEDEPSGLLSQAASVAQPIINAAPEAIDAANLLGNEDGNTVDTPAELATAPTQGEGNNLHGGVEDLPVLTGGMEDSGRDVQGAERIGAADTGHNAIPDGSSTNGALDRPFATAADDFLPKMRSMTTDAKVIGQIDNEMELRGLKPVEVSGQKIDKDWTAFNPNTGTLGIPRSEMPQVKAEHRGALVNFLNARDITHEQETVPASSLKPTQQEFSEAKVEKALGFEGNDRSILVSSDNHVVDGHHQWLAKLKNDDDVNVIRLNAPIKDLLETVKEFPSTTVEDGATQAASVTDAVATNDAVRPLVEQLTKLRASADKHASYEPALQAAKDFMNGKSVPAAKFKNLAKLLKPRSPLISDVLTQLHSLAENAPDVLAAKEAKSKQAKQQAQARMKLDTTKDGLMQAMAKLGGLNSEAAKSEFGIDPADMKNHGAGILRSFKSNGLDADTMRELLLEQGYPVGETVADLGNAIADAMDGIDVLTPEGQEALAQKRYEEYANALEELSDSEQAALDAYLAEAETLLGADIVASIDASLADDMKGQPQVEIERALIGKLKETLHLEKGNRLANEIANTEREDRAASQYTGSEESSSATERPAGVDSQSSGSETDGQRAQQDGAKTQSQVTDLLGDDTRTKQQLADAERAKDTKRNSGADNQDTFTLTGSNSEADKAAAAGAQDLFVDSNKMVATPKSDEADNQELKDRKGRVLKVGDNVSGFGRFNTIGKFLPNAEGKLVAYNTDGRVIGRPVQLTYEDIGVKDKSRFSDNKVFTADKVEAARARLKSKLGNINSGIDPELLIDGMTIAGAYIESGVREFTAYAKLMTEDFGDSIKPYLLSFYEAARAYPSIDKNGMTSAEQAEKLHAELLTPAVKELVKDVIGNGIVETAKAKAKPNGQLKLTQDWGVDDINGYGSDRDDGRGDETKEAFLAEGKKYLGQVAKLLEAEGFEPHKDQRGRLEKSVSVNAGGMAGSGEVSLTMRKGNAGVYVNLGTSAIRGLTGKHPQGVSLMIRATNTADTDRYATKGQNTWLSTDLNSTELANKLMQTAERYVKTTEQANEENQNARPNQAESISRRGAQSDLLAEQPRSGNSEPVDSGLARTSDQATGNESVSNGVSTASGNREASASGINGSAPSGSREASNAGNTAGTASDLNNHSIADDAELGGGSAAKKYRDNINAIKLIKTLESENRIATPQERDQLAKYSGFGSLAGAFDRNNKQYSKEYTELKELLTPEEYESARASILNAYYTSKPIVNAMYDGLAHLGFKGGRVLEPSMGSGNFFGLMPASLRNKSKLNGVELDSLTSRLAKQLYPNANIATSTGFEKYEAPNGYFDLVIGNPPFGSEKITDGDKRGYSGFSIHNYFLAKSIDKLRDGGVMAVVVSHSFMDAQNPAARQWIAQRANLIGAVRLPSEAFKESAGTEVITDILYFQKTDKPEANPDWLKATDQGGYTFNDYFLGNPRNVLGRITDTTNQFGKTFTIESTGNMANQLKEFNSRLPQNIYVEPAQRVEVLDSADNTIPDGVKVGTYYQDDKGGIRQRLPDLLGAKRSSVWEAPNAKANERMLGMMALRDLLRSQMRLERDPMADEAAIERNRQRLNARYDAFLKEFGHLNNTTNRRLFLDDTESALLQALELDYDQGVTKARSQATGMEEKAPSAQKADIFKRRVLFPPSDSINVESGKDALLSSLNAKGSVDLDYMADVYSKPKADILKELGDLVYNDPNKGYVTADEYLSGDVKTKLAEAQHAAKTDGELKRNVEALEKVIPKDKLPSEIYVSAGANWVPASVYESFVSEITGIPADGVEYKYLNSAGIWLHDRTKGGDAAKMTSEYGTDKLSAFDLFNLLINGKSAEVKKSVINANGDRTVTTDVEATEAARAKYQKIKEAWSSWVFKDAERADKLASIYNEKHNRIVNRKFDGSHMQFYGMSPAITLRPHQKDVVWRGIQDRVVLLDHVVGAGKTMAMAALAMEMKRLGIARKPFFVVPNHLTLQWRSEFTKLYPASNILAATPEDFAKDKREKLFSKMVTGNYDAIIIGHSSLSKVGLPKEVEEKMYSEQVKEITSAIELAKQAKGDRGITRTMEQIKKNLEAKIEKIKAKTASKDNVVSFDELGIDALFADEMHEFKNLFFTTQMQRTAGLGNPTGSGKALDMFMKIRWMQDTYGENTPLVTATGTPVSNSLAEMFTMQRYMKYEEMKRQDLHLFDAWAKQFGEVENVYEVAPSGVGYRQSTRFSKFKNLPALMGNYSSFADVITMQDLKQQAIDDGKVFPVPKIKSGKPINEIAQRSELQRDFFGVPKLAEDESGNIQFDLDPVKAKIEENKDGKYVLNYGNGFETFDTKEEAELQLVSKALTPKTFIDPKSLLGQFANLAELTRKSNGKINALSLTGLANKAGLDYRIIDPSAPDFAGSKINKAVANMLQLWKDTAKDNGTQIVFCDLSIPLSARGDMASKEKRVYVRNEAGELTHKAKGIIYAPAGLEGYPFFIVSEGKGAVSVYEAVSGSRMPAYGVTDKASAKAWVDRYVENESNRDRIFAMRDAGTIDQSDIEEYRDAKELEVADDGSNEVSTADLEALAGSSQFSVYDDIKDKLVKSGVPENQIAFIHDYNTPKQKEELFKRVNRGDVRFLFGSTPKLGAGTNVQKLLVGLHHIDAPWRPSDLEQREGRIVRQGNDLYARDPENFEVAIYRYATEQTYDTRRWQLLEHKAAGIEQLRKYTGESEIEDVASEASNSADMKAAASGNPLILEETKLRTEVKRLQSLERAHADAQYAMARKIKANEQSVTDYYPRMIEKYQDMKAKAEANPVPADKLKVASINIDGKRATTREMAENDIGLLATKVRQSYDVNESRKVIYRGIEFTFNRGFGVGAMRLESPDGTMHTYTEKEGVSPSGLLTRFNNYIDSFDARIEDAHASIKRLNEESNSLKPRLNLPFEDEHLLKDTQAEHADVQRRLMKSSQLEAIPESQRPEFDRLIKQRKGELISLGFEDALKKADSDKPMFSRKAKTVESGLSKQAVQSAVDKLRTVWANAPQIVVIDSMNDPAVPEAVRIENESQQSMDAKGAPEGFYYAGKVYVLAPQINDANDLIRVVFHETLGHYGLRGLYGKELGEILDQVAMLRRRDVAKKAKQYGLDIEDKRGLRAAAEEVLAEMAQTAPTLGFVKRAVAAIRKFLRKLGMSLELTDDDIIANYLLPARDFVVNGRKETKAGQQAALAFSRDDSPNMAQLFKELTLNDDMFQYAKSDATDMQEVFNDVVPNLVRVDLAIAPEGVDEKYIVYPRDRNGKALLDQEGIINVYPDGKVEINVASWDKGYGGSGIYSAVGNWAFNNGKVFAGDRDGITPDGKLRRLENMISMGLKFGTTDHIAPHPDQMRDLGFKWKDGDTEYNLGQMLEASYKAIRNGVYVTERLSQHHDYTVTHKSLAAVGVDKLDDLVYDFDKQQFTDISNGHHFTDTDFAALAKTARARATNAGSSTLKRAAIANTILRAQGQERKRLLERIGQLAYQALEGTQLTGAFYSRSTTQSNPQSRLAPQWDSLTDSKFDDAIRALQDKHVDLKRVTENIQKAGNAIDDRWNAYLQEELYHGRTAKRTQDFLKNELEPLLEDMRARHVTMADFEHYLWARHAEERNKQIATINPEMPDGGSGMETAEAKRYLMNLSAADKANYEDLAKRVDAINRASQQVLVDYGLESAGTVAQWNKAYKHYVPLMREDMETGFGNGTGQGFSIKGSSTKRALGSTKGVVDIIANIAQQREKNIVRGEKNRVSTALIGLAKLNPNEDFWKVDSPPTIRAINKSTGLVEDFTDPNYKNRNNVVVARIRNLQGNIVEKSVVFNDRNERAMKMASSIKNLELADSAAWIEAVAKVTRWFSSVNTQYNPIFGVLNLLRDVQGSMLNLSTTPIAGKQKEVTKLVMPALKGIYQDMRSVRAGNGATNSAWAQLWEEFQREGGQTGYRNMYANAADRAEALKKSLDPEWWAKTKLGKVVSANGTLVVPEQMLKDKVVKPVFEWLSDYNETLENATRLAVYKVAIENGQSKQQAASIAKNISVNFNRKGTEARWLGSFYAFFNASVQGSARIATTLNGKRGKQIIAGGLALGVVQALAMAAAGYDDEEPPEYIRDRNIVIPLDAIGVDQKYVTIPMPLGFNAIPNLGRIATEWALSGFSDTARRTKHTFEMMLDVLNPVGGSGSLLNTLAPTVVDPVVDLSVNKDFTGKPIAREDINTLSPTAGFTRAKDTATPISKWVSKAINSLTGGTDYTAGEISPTPDQIDYLIGQVAGGVGREIMKVQQTAKAMVTGEDLPSYKVPLVGRFYGDANGQSSQSTKFYENVQMLNKLEQEIKGRRSDHIETDSFKNENPAATLIGQGKFIYKQVSKLRKTKREKLDNGAPASEIQEIDKKITERMAKLNNLVKARKEETRQ